MNHTVDTPTFLPSSNPRVPKAEQPFRHCMPMQIRFTDIDMMGHLNNNVYLTFMDLAKIDYFTTLRPGEVDMNNLNMVVVHIDVDFYPDVLQYKSQCLISYVDSYSRNFLENNLYHEEI